MLFLQERRGIHDGNGIDGSPFSRFVVANHLKKKKKEKKNLRERCATKPVPGYQ
jgi:hypothetical protein